MVNIPPFEVTAWIDGHEESAKHDLAGTACSSISINELLDISEHRARSAQALSLENISLSYTEPMQGSHALRDNLAALYSARAQGVTRDDIVMTNGGVSANHIVLSALVGPGDHVICHYPTYEQLYQTPKSLGAEVSLWKSEPSKKWQLDIEELKSMIKSNTKMIIINNPHNPSGAIVPKPRLEEIVEIAEEKGIIVLSDEVFRPLFHSILPSHDDFPPSMINLGYKQVIVTGSLSKAYSLPGIRTGWIASRNKELIATCLRMRHYTMTTVSRLDEAVAAEALSDRCIHALLARNIKFCQTNLELVQGFIDEHSWACSWVRPVAGTTAMIRFHKTGKPVDDVQFCQSVQEKTGLLLVPGCKCFGDSTDFRGCVRIGIGHNPETVKASLAAFTSFMEEHYESVPVVAK